MSSDIEQWLGNLNLGKYAPAFKEAEIDLLALPYLTDEDLKDLGLPLGPRRKVIGASSELATAKTSVDPKEARTDRIPPQPPIDQARIPSNPSLSPERRFLTVMFVDLVDSTVMSSRFDVETLRDVITGYQNTVAGVISRHRGFIARFMGDGVLCYFGWPQAGENDAERAIRAGLEIIGLVKEVTCPGETQLATRIGVASGVVVVGDLIGSGASEEAAVIGETPNLAARLQGLAEPNQLVLSRETSNLLGKIFALKSLGSSELKGIAAPVSVFAVTGLAPLQSRFDAQQTGTLAPLHGRDTELNQIQEQWVRAQSGDGQLVLITGEAGIGKSRLTRAMVESVTDDDHNFVVCQCSPYHMDSALHPVIAQVAMLAGWDAHDCDDTRVEKLARLVDAEPEKLSLLATMMGVGHNAQCVALELSPAVQRSRTMRVICEVIIRLAKDRPLLFVFEDLHWIDPTSLELLDILLESIEHQEVLILATSRPTFTHEFGGHPAFRRVSLNRLDYRGVVAIAEQLSVKPLPEEVLQTIASRTDGVPLFVEELTKTILESNVLTEHAHYYESNGTLDTSAIPSTLHGSLMARLDRLEQLKLVAQTAACIGREFSHVLIAEVSQMSDSRLGAALQGLVDGELVYQRGIAPESSYTFKHALVRDAAYESLLKGPKQKIHNRIVEVLEQDSDTPPELLAQHAEAANHAAQAADLWEIASETALARPAYGEAISHLERAIALVNRNANGRSPLTIDPDSLNRNLVLQVKLGQARYFGNGYGDSRTIAAFKKALDLAAVIGETPLRFTALHGTWRGHYIHGEYHSALHVGRRMLEDAERGGDGALIALANRLIGSALYSLGCFVDARRHLVTAQAMYDPKADESANNSDIDHGVSISCNMAGTMWNLGATQQADRHMADAESAALAKGEINTICYMHNYLAGITRSARKSAESAHHPNSLLKLATDHGLPFYAAQARSQLAVLAAGDGDPDAIDHFLEADAYCITIGKLAVPSIRIDAGHYALAMNLVEKARLLAQMAHDLIEVTGETVALANLHRLNGALAVKLGQNNVAEAHLTTAITVAREQRSKIWELRAALDLCALLHSTERGGEGCRLLQNVLDNIADGDCAADVAIARQYFTN